MKDLIEELVSRRRIGLTTFARDDRDSADRLQTAIARGSDELLFWGLGPSLEEGDIVALYATNNPWIPPQDRKKLSRLYSIAAIVPGRTFRHHVFLHRAVEISAIPYAQLRDKPLNLKPAEIWGAGSATLPWTADRCREFWKLVLKTNPDFERPIRTRLLDAPRSYDVAISYAGEDWTQANRLKRWCESGGKSVFFVTSTGEMFEDEQEQLGALLGSVFSYAKLAVFLMPRVAADSDWLQAERAAAASGGSKILLLRSDSDRAWPSDKFLKPIKNRVDRLEYSPGDERAAFKKINALLKGIS